MCHMESQIGCQVKCDRDCQKRCQIASQRRCQIECKEYILYVRIHAAVGTTWSKVICNGSSLAELVRTMQSAWFRDWTMMCLTAFTENGPHNLNKLWSVWYLFIYILERNGGFLYPFFQLFSILPYGSTCCHLLVWLKHGENRLPPLPLGVTVFVWLLCFFAGVVTQINWLWAAFSLVWPFLWISFHRLPGFSNLAHMSLRRPWLVNLCW